MGAHLEGRSSFQCLGATAAEVLTNRLAFMHADSGVDGQREPRANSPEAFGSQVLRSYAACRTASAAPRA